MEKSIARVATILTEGLNLFRGITKEGEAYLLDFAGGFKYVNEATLRRLAKEVSEYKRPCKAVLIFDVYDDEKWKLI